MCRDDVPKDLLSVTLAEQLYRRKVFFITAQEQYIIHQKTCLLRSQIFLTLGSAYIGSKCHFPIPFDKIYTKIRTMYVCVGSEGSAVQRTCWGKKINIYIMIYLQQHGGKGDCCEANQAFLL